MILVNYCTEEEQKLVCIKFNANGIGHVDTSINNFETIFKSYILEAVENSLEGQDIAQDIKDLLFKKREEV